MDILKIFISGRAIEIQKYCYNIFKKWQIGAGFTLGNILNTTFS